MAMSIDFVFLYTSHATFNVIDHLRKVLIISNEDTPDEFKISILFIVSKWFPVKTEKTVLSTSIKLEFEIILVMSS